MPLPKEMRLTRAELELMVILVGTVSSYDEPNVLSKLVHKFDRVISHEERIEIYQKWSIRESDAEDDVFLSSISVVRSKD